jgi:hypothetical protein
VRHLLVIGPHCLLSVIRVDHVEESGPFFLFIVFQREHFCISNRLVNNVRSCRLALADRTRL